MTMGNKKYVNPSGVLQAIVDDNGNQIQIGEENDIREFNNIFLSRISDTLKAHAKSQMPADEPARQEVHAHEEEKQQPLLL